MLHEYIKAGLSDSISVNLSLFAPIAEMPDYCNSLSAYICFIDFASTFCTRKYQKLVIQVNNIWI